MYRIHGSRGCRGLRELLVKLYRFNLLFLLTRGMRCGSVTEKIKNF